MRNALAGLAAFVLLVGFALPAPCLSLPWNGMNGHQSCGPPSDCHDHQHPARAPNHNCCYGDHQRDLAARNTPLLAPSPVAGHAISVTLSDSPVRTPLSTASIEFCSPPSTVLRI